MSTPIRFNSSGEGWHLRTRRRVLPLLAGGLVLVAFCGLGASMLARGDQSGWASIALGLLIGLIPFVLPRRGRQPARTITHEGRPATLVPINAFSPAAIVGFGLFGLAMGACAAVLAWSAVADQEWKNLVGAVLLGGISALCLGAVFGGLRQRSREDLGIVLDAEGLTITDQAVPARVPWAEIARVRDHWTRAERIGVPTPDDQIRNWLTFELEHEPETSTPFRPYLNTPHPTVGTDALAMDPEVVRDVCRLYLEHPELRHELGGSDALARLGVSTAPLGAVRGD